MNSFPERTDIRGAMQFEQSNVPLPEQRTKLSDGGEGGYSIAFGPTPIGRVVQEQPISTLGPEPWFVTKISNATDLAKFRGSFSKEWREPRENR
jgi:hypothetical protein